MGPAVAACWWALELPWRSRQRSWRQFWRCGERGDRLEAAPRPGFGAAVSDTAVRVPARPARPAPLCFDVGVLDGVVAVVVAAVARSHPLGACVFALNVALAMPLRQVPPGLGVHLSEAVAAARPRLAPAGAGRGAPSAPAAAEGHDSGARSLHSGARSLHSGARSLLCWEGDRRGRACILEAAPNRPRGAGAWAGEQPRGRRFRKG